MRHKKHKYKLGVQPSHRVSLMKNLASEIIDHGKIKTTHAKCKALQIYVEKIITFAKKDTVANRRLCASRLGNNRDIVKKLFTEVAPKFVDRPGGYTRIMKLADGRVGDNAKMSYISFVE
jgi:large subunit ribosomal protein L17